METKATLAIKFNSMDTIVLAQLSNNNKTIELHHGNRYMGSKLIDGSNHQTEINGSNLNCFQGKFIVLTTSSGPVKTEHYVEWVRVVTTEINFKPLNS